MTEVVIAGIGQTEVGEHWEIGLRDLAYAAIHDAVKDSGGLKPQSLFVGNMLAPSLSNQAHLGVLLADYAGMLGIEAVTIEAAGASGGAALRQGYLAVASGMLDCALAVGFEQMQPGALTGGLNWYRAMFRLAIKMGREAFIRKFQVRVTVPTLILWGDRDAFLEPYLADRSLDWVENGKLVHFPETTHWLQHEEPERVNNRLIDFLRED